MVARVLALRLSVCLSQVGVVEKLETAERIELVLAWDLNASTYLFLRRV